MVRWFCTLFLWTKIKFSLLQYLLRGTKFLAIFLHDILAFVFSHSSLALSPKISRSSVTELFDLTWPNRLRWRDQGWEPFCYDDLMFPSQNLLSFLQSNESLQLKVIYLTDKLFGEWLISFKFFVVEFAEKNSYWYRICYAFPGLWWAFRKW